MARNKYNFKPLIIYGLLITNFIFLFAMASLIYYKYATSGREKHVVDILSMNQEKNEKGNELNLFDYSEESGVEYSLDRFIINLKDKGNKTYINLQIVLVFDSEDMIDETEKNLPLIRDSIILIVSGKKSSDLAKNKEKNQLIDEIISELNKTFTYGKIKKLYFKTFIIF